MIMLGRLQGPLRLGQADVGVFLTPRSQSEVGSVPFAVYLARDTHVSTPEPNAGKAKETGFYLFNETHLLCLASS